MSQATIPQEGPLPLTNSKRSWDEEGFHTFLVHDEDRYETKTDPVNVILDIRSGIDKLPETAATFTLKDVLDEHRPQAVRPEYMALAGTWKVPAHVSPCGSKTGANHWANPNYADAYLYSDAIVRCKCGNAFLRPESIKGDVNIAGAHDHGDDCKPQYRWRARAQLAEKREQIIATMALLDNGHGEIAPRLGLSTRSITELARTFNLEMPDLIRRGKELAAETMYRLLEYCDTYTVGAVYARSDEGVSHFIRKYTDHDYDANELANDRKRRGTRQAWRAAHNRGMWR